jgi:hypothetical protein
MVTINELLLLSLLFVTQEIDTLLELKRPPSARSTEQAGHKDREQRGGERYSTAWHAPY